MISRTCLALCLLVASSMTGTQAFDRLASVSRADACGKTQRAVPDRCVATKPETVPETIVYGTMSDHGPGYDAQGNPVDRHGNIVAVPKGRPASGQVREVFIGESRQ